MMLQRYWAARRRICTIVNEGVELGPFPADPEQSDALCQAVVRDVPHCHDALAILEEVLGVRGSRLVEGLNGEWGWSGIRVNPAIVAAANA